MMWNGSGSHGSRLIQLRIRLRLRWSILTHILHTLGDHWHWLTGHLRHWTIPSRRSAVHSHIVHRHLSMRNRWHIWRMTIVDWSRLTPTVAIAIRHWTWEAIPRVLLRKHSISVRHTMLRWHLIAIVPWTRETRSSILLIRRVW